MNYYPKWTWQVIWMKLKMFRLHGQNFRTRSLKKMEKCIPKGKIPKRKNLPWLTNDLTKMMRKRNRHFKRARSSNKDEVKYRKLRNQVVTKLREAKNDFFHKLKPSSKDFWKAIKCLNRDTSSIPTLHKMVQKQTQT